MHRARSSPRPPPTSMITCCTAPPGHQPVSSDQGSKGGVFPRHSRLNHGEHRIRTTSSQAKTACDATVPGPHESTAEFEMRGAAAACCTQACRVKPRLGGAPVVGVLQLHVAAHEALLRVVRHRHLEVVRKLLVALDLVVLQPQSCVLSARCLRQSAETRAARIGRSWHMFTRSHHQSQHLVTPLITA